MSAYFLAKIICDVLPLRVLPTVVFAAISYWMIGMCINIYIFVTYPTMVVINTSNPLMLKNALKV